MNNVLEEISLQAGGSHYPTINPRMQEAFARIIIAKCVDIVKQAGTHCAHTTFDLGIVECTREEIAAAICEHFQVHPHDILNVHNRNQE
jgi:2C-methyl-D-erythritol 2,4-cyclodiphosphate synthase